MVSPILKVAAYIIQRQQGELRLLAFRHRDDPETTLQLPGGTVDPGEALEEAIRREVFEESGLSHLELIGKVGEDPFSWQGRPHVRHFFLFHAPEEVPGCWEHIVTGNGEDAGIVYAYEWLPPAAWGQLHHAFHVFLGAVK